MRLRPFTYLFAALGSGAFAGSAQAQISYTPYSITTLAGSPGSGGSANGQGSAASFSSPFGVAVDAQGNIYVADGNNHAVRKVTPGGSVSTLATAVNSGNGAGSSFGVLGGIAIDAAGQNLYVTDYSYGSIYKITLAGAATVFLDSGRLTNPYGLALDSAGNVYVADTGAYVIRKITPVGVMTVLAGSLANGSGIANGTGSAAQFDYPVGVAVDGSGNVYVTDAAAEIIRKITPTGVVSTYAGQPTGIGTVDGNTSIALFNDPGGIAIDGAGDLFVTDSRQMVREITAGGTVTSLAGTTSRAGSTDGVGSSALFSFSPPAPAGIAVDAAGNLYIADTNNDTVRKGTLAAASPPAIQIQPQSQTVVSGGSVTFSVTVTGTGPFSYQWTSSGGAITGATGSSYTIPSVTANNAGAYQVVVTGAGGTVFSALATLTVSPTPSSPVITSQPPSQSVLVAGSVTFTVAAAGVPAPTFQWNFNGSPISGATSSSYTINAVTTANSGSYTVTITNANGSVTSNGGVLAVQATGAPAITAQPQSQSMATGSTVVLSVASSGTVTISSSVGSGDQPEAVTPATYQWYLNGVAISGATNSTLLIQNLSAANAGSYSCVVSNASGSTLSSTAFLTVAATANPGRLINLSILSNIQGSLSMGFVIGGSGTSGSENLLIRATGPALTAFGSSGVMPDPTLTVYQQVPSTKISANAGWGTPASNATAVQAADAATGAFALTNTTSLDSAVVLNLAPVSGGYSAAVTGKSGDNGYALTEVYDDTPTYAPTDTRPINLSCLTQIAIGGTLDVGFVVGGSTSKTVLIRVGGPALNALFGIAGVMADPQMQISPLSSTGTVLAANAGWGGNTQIISIANSVGAYTWPTSPAGADSATLVTLAPGPYTVQVNSVSGAGGTVLVEIYDVP